MRLLGSEIISFICWHNLNNYYKQKLSNLNKEKKLWISQEEIWRKIRENRKLLHQYLITNTL